MSSVKTDQAGPPAPPAAPQKAARDGRRIPLLQAVLPIEIAQLPAAVVAGVTLAALAIPEVMGYTSIAGMPVITGLYTILIPISVFAIIGSSRHLVVGADSATAAIMAAGLVGLAATASPKYVALAGLAAVITGALLLVARLLRLGFLADFLSRSVLIGFLTGVGIQVAAGQVAGMLGVKGGGGGTIQDLGGSETIAKLLTALSQIPQTSLSTLGVSVAVLGVILGARLINPRIPGALIAVIGAIGASWAFSLSSHGVKVLGTVPSGLPKFGFPSVTWSDVVPLLAICFSLFIVILAQSAATSRAYAARHNEHLDENWDLVGLSLANASAGLSGTFIVNGSPTKTQMVESAGGQSQLSQLITAVIVLLVLLFLTGPLALMPKAVLASVVFLIGIELIDIAGMRKVLRARPSEFVVATVTALVVVVVGVEQAIILAIVVSLLDHVRRGYSPKNSLLAPSPAGHWQWTAIASGAEFQPGLVVYRFNHSLYYANAERLLEEILGLVGEAQVPVRWFCIDASAIDDIDYSAGATLLQVATNLKERGIRLVFADVEDAVRSQLDRYGVTAVVGREAFFIRLRDLLDEYERRAADGHTSLR